MALFGGGIITLNDSVKFDFFRLEGNTMIHKQLEKRDGFTYLRLKKRKIIKLS
ncbi:MAG: hypothetical protein V1740_05135 [Candidatus Woesearchaeota archaeon]